MYMITKQGLANAFVWQVKPALVINEQKDQIYHLTNFT